MLVCFYLCIIHACRTWLVYLRYYWWLAHIKKQSSHFSRPLGQVLSTNFKALVWLTGMDRNAFYIRGLYTCVKIKSNFPTCLTVILTNCQTSGYEKVAVYFLKTRSLWMPNHFALFIYLGNVLIFFSFPLEAISLRLVYSIFRTFASFFFFRQRPVTSSLYICSTQRLMLPLISSIYIFQTLMPPLISSLIDKFAGAASSVLDMLEMNSNHAIPDAAL